MIAPVDIVLMIATALVWLTPFVILGAAIYFRHK